MGAKKDARRAAKAKAIASALVAAGYKSSSSSMLFKTAGGGTVRVKGLYPAYTTSPPSPGDALLQRADALEAEAVGLVDVAVRASYMEKAATLRREAATVTPARVDELRAEILKASASADEMIDPVLTEAFRAKVSKLTAELAALSAA